jgi:hypothetical protein
MIWISRVSSWMKLPFVVAMLASSACVTSYVKPPDGAPPSTATAQPEEMDDADMAAIGNLLGCTPKSEKFFCRAMVAFAGGSKPTGHPTAVALAGASAIIPSPDSPDAGQPVAYETSYLVLANEGVRYGTVLPTTDEERASAKALFVAVTGGQAIPTENSTAVYARTRKGTNPAQATGLSLFWSQPTKGFARQTSMGIVVIERAPGMLAVGVFPAQ